MTLPLRARIFLWMMSLAATGWLAYWLAVAPRWAGMTSSRPAGVAEAAHTLTLIALLLALGVVAQHFPVPVLPRYKTDTSMAVYFALMVLFSPPLAMALVGASQLIGQGTLFARRDPASGKRRRSLRSVLFNTSQLMISTGAGALVLHLATPAARSGSPVEASLWAVPAAGAAFYGVNSLAVATIVGLQRRENPLRVWYAGLRLDAIQATGLLLIGLMTAIVAREHLWAPIAMAVPAALVYLSLKRSLQLTEQMAAAAAAVAAREEAVAAREEAVRRLALQAEELAHRRAEAAEARLRQQQAEAAALRQLDQAKDELIAVLSHEMRTPLTSLMGFAELLLTRSYPEEKRRQFLAVMLQNGQRLQQLANNFLDLQRMDSGLEHVSVLSVDVRVLLAGAKAASPIDPAHPIVVDVPAALPPVLAEPERVRQVLANLLDNARKYSPRGGEIHLSARAVGESVQVTVRDHGLGVPPDALPRLFQKFYRVDSADRQSIKGTGLGLAICRKIVEAHGGRIWAESDGQGEGTRICFTLPIAQAPAVTREAAPVAPAAIVAPAAGTAVAA